MPQLERRITASNTIANTIEDGWFCAFSWRQGSMRKDTIDFIGYIAATCTTVSFLPQLLRVLRRRSAKDVSLGMFVVLSAGTALWLTYGLLSHSRPVTAANAVTLVLTISILILKLRFDRDAFMEVTGV
jgi:MtN3 and saliva related transmembrane protein